MKFLYLWTFCVFSGQNLFKPKMYSKLAKPMGLNTHTYVRTYIYIYIYIAMFGYENIHAVIWLVPTQWRYQPPLVIQPLSQSPMGGRARAGPGQGGWREAGRGESGRSSRPGEPSLRRRQGLGDCDAMRRRRSIRPHGDQFLPPRPVATAYTLPRTILQAFIRRLLVQISPQSAVKTAAGALYDFRFLSCWGGAWEFLTCNWAFLSVEMIDGFWDKISIWVAVVLAAGLCNVWPQEALAAQEGQVLGGLGCEVAVDSRYLRGAPRFRELRHLCKVPRTMVGVEVGEEASEGARRECGESHQASQVKRSCPWWPRLHSQEALGRRRHAECGLQACSPLWSRSQRLQPGCLSMLNFWVTLLATSWKLTESVQFDEDAIFCCMLLFVSVEFHCCWILPRRRSMYRTSDSSSCISFNSFTREIADYF